MVENGVILVVDAEAFEVLFGKNLAFTRQHIQCGIFN